MDRSYSLGIYEKAMPNSLGLREKLETAKLYGYDFLEMSIDETDQKLERLDMDGHQKDLLIGAMRDTGIPVRSICLSGHRKYPMGSQKANVRARSMEIMRKAVGLAHDLGVRIIQIAGYDVYYEQSNSQTKELFFNNLRVSAEIAAKFGVTLAFETMETPFMDTAEKAMAYVKEINSPYLQVYPDIGNCTNAAHIYGKDVFEDILSARGHIAAMHLKETVPGKYREIEFGEGHVDFVRAIETAIGLGVRMFVTEFWDVPDIDYKEHISFSKGFVDSMFKKAYS